MCLPLNFLQFITRYTSLTIALIGITLICLSLIDKEAFIYGIGASVGMYTCFTSLCGYLGQRYKSCVCMTCFNISFMGMLLFLLMLTLFSRKLEYIYQIDFAESNFCSNRCQCYISEDTQWPTFQYLAYYNYTSNSTYPIRNQDCPNFKKFKFNIASNMQLIEEENNCAGMYYTSPIYLFSDVNNGVPLKPCEYFLDEYLLNTPDVYQLIILILDVISGFFCIVTFCFCCHPQNKSQRMYPIINYKLVQKL